ncbi:HEAT repeat domain-containing protein [Streptomyces sp. NPDC055632]
MRGFFKRRKAPQTASGASVQGPLTQISGVRGDVHVTVGSVPSQPAPPEIESARQAYATRVRQRYGRLDLEVLTPLREQDEHPVLQLRDVFVPQSVRADPPPVELPQELLRRLMDPAEAELHDLPPGIDRETADRVRRAYRERPPLPVLDVLTAPEHDRVVLLGHPGSGKSTLARYLALTLTSPEPPADLHALRGSLPLIVELREYAQPAWRERTFEDFLAHQHATEGLGLPPETLTALLAGVGPYSALVIFDGLDELFEKDIRDAVTRRIAGFAARHPLARIVVTSRGYGYQRAVLDGAGFTNFMLQDLDREQIGAFAEQWFSLACPDDPAQARKLIERVTTAVDASTSVRELAGNPLILTILAIIGRRRELPRDRRTVYEHAVDVLVEHWDPSKYLKDRRVEEHLPYLGPEDKRELLRLIARQMQEGHGGISGNHIAGPDLLKSFEEYLKDRYALPPDRAATAARVMLDQFRHRNFILSRYGGEIYGFVHRTFLEYLAATDLAHRFNHERTVSEEELGELYVAKAEDPAWHETLLLLVGLLDERFVARVIDRLLGPQVPARPLDSEDDRAVAGLPFAARCLAEVRRPGPLAPQAASIVRRLIRLLELCREYNVFFDRGSPGFKDIARALTGLGDHASARRLYLRWHDAWSRDHRTRGIRFITDGIGWEAAEIRLHFLHHESGNLSSVLWKEARGNPDPSTRLVATLQAVEAGLPGAKDLLRDRFVHETHAGLRAAMVDELGHDEDPGPKTVPFLLDRLRHETDHDARESVLAALTRTAVTAPEARAWLLRALREGSTPTRLGIIRNITLHQMRDREIRVLLLRNAEDGEPETRESALSTLSFFPMGDDEQRLLVVALRMADAEDTGLRSAALMALAGLTHRHGEARRVVLYRVRHDPFPEIRRQLVDTIGREWNDRDGTRSVLLDRLLHDEDPGVRVAALSSYRYDPPEDAGTLEAVVAQALFGETPLVRRAAFAALLPFDQSLEVLDFLQALAAKEEDAEARAAMTGSLLARADRVRGGRLTRERAVHDPSPVVRSAALEALRDRHRDLGTLSLAHDRAANDEDPEVRRTALRVLTDLGRDDPRTLDLLRTAAQDVSADVRGFAARLLPILEGASE